MRTAPRPRATRLAAACSLALLGAGSAFGARPMKLEDLLLAVRVTDPQLSPDGKQIAYVRTTTDLGSGKRNADVWIMNADGASPRQLTRSEKSDASPRLSRDGRLAFISARDGTPQVYVMDLAGGEAKKLTSFAAGAQPPLVWSPDGKRLAVVADVFPDCPDEACNRKRTDEKEKDPVKVHHMTRLLYRHWDEWREDVRHHVFVVDAETGAARDVTPGDFDSPTVQSEDDGIAFSPDGKELAFVSNRDGNDKEASSTNMDVFVVAVDAAKPAAEKVTDNPAADVAPRWSPDGRLLAVRAQRRAGFESDRWYLDVYDRRAKTRRTLFTQPDLAVSEYAFSPDAKTVYFTAEKDARTDLFAVDAAGGAPREVVRGGHISGVVPSAASLVFAKSTLTAPAELFTSSLDGKNVRQLTKENEAWLKEASFTAPESKTVESGGRAVQYWLVRPPAFDAGKKYPIVFLIHGGPQGAWEDGWSYRWNPSLWAAQGWVVVAPNPTGSTGFGQPFVDAISGDWGGQVMKDLDAVFDASLKLPFVDPARAGIAGASYGGYAVDWILGHEPNRFKAAVTHDGVFNLESESLGTEEQWFSDWEFKGTPYSAQAREQYAKWSPHLHADKIVTPTLVITNELDFRVLVEQGLQLFTVLKRRGIPSEALVFPDEGHWVLKPLNSKRWHETVFGWMKRWLEK